MKPRTYYRHLAVVTVMAGTLGACSDPNAPRVAAPTVPRAQLEEAAQAEMRAAAQGASDRGFEDWILRLEANAPGVGGVFYDSSGTIVVLAQQGADHGRIVAELRRWSTDPSLATALRSSAASAQVEFRPADFVFSELVAWERRALPQLVREVPELVATDADEKLNRLRVRVTTEAARASVERVIASLGIPQSALVVERGERISLASNVRGTFRPTAGGLQIASGNTFSWFRCTLGFNVTTEYSFITNPPEVGFLTASHCVSGDHASGTTGETIYSPVIGSQYAVGTVFLNAPWNSTDPACSGIPRCTSADAMFVRYTDASNAAKKVFITESVGLNYNGGSITTTGWWTNIQPAIVASVGHSVDKLGRTTGWTRGSVAGTCENQLVGDPQGNVMDLCVNRVTGSRVGEGDSGAPVYLSISGSSTTPLYPAGLLFAGGPNNAQDNNDGGTLYCTTGCEYLYTPWAAINARLGRSFNPAP